MDTDHGQASKAIAFLSACGFTTFTAEHGDAKAVAGSLRLRAGVSVARVVRLDIDGVDDLGYTVGRAARLCAVAQPWQVRAGAKVAGTRFALHRIEGEIRVQPVVGRSVPVGA